MEDEQLLLLADLFTDEAKAYVNRKMTALEDEIKGLRELVNVQAKTIADWRPVVDKALIDFQQSIADRAIAYIDKRFLEIPQPKDGRDGIDGKDGRDAEVNYGVIKEYVLAEVAKTPKPQDGKDGRAGKDGKDAEPIDVESIVATVAQRIPVPKDGKDGRNGKDANPEEIRGIVLDEVQKAISAIPRAKDGLPGRDGKDGKDGESIHPDSVALMIVTEVAKQVGKLPIAKDGRDGINGKDGRDGRDAMEIDILPSIDLMKSYPRGTVATMNGGTWFARVNTSIGQFKPEEWQVVSCGFLKPIVEQSEDCRTISFTFPMTNGESYFYKFSSPALLYREIWNAEKTYTRGDVVTYDGCAWHCQVESTTVKPADKNTDWRMMVRKGNEGKPGIPGTKGEPGKDGRDLTRIGQGTY